jgi:hypothetical protein
MLSFAVASLSGISADSLAQNSVSNAEVISGDIRTLLDNPAKVIGNVKVGWSTKADWGKGMTSTLSTSYDLKANRNFVKDVKLGGDFKQWGARLAYELTQGFADGGLGATGLNLKASSPKVVGMALEAEYDTAKPDHIKSLSLPLDYKCGEVCKLSGKTEWLGSAKAMKYAAAATFQPASKFATKLKATISHAVEAGGPSLSYEAGIEQGVDKGRSLTANVKNSKVLALEYTDAAVDPAATWVVGWDMPLDAGAKDAFLQPKVLVKRKWAF